MALKFRIPTLSKKKGFEIASLLEDLGGNTENKWKSVAEDWFR
jgi:hypothetical protein